MRTITYSSRFYWLLKEYCNEKFYIEWCASYKGLIASSQSYCNNIRRLHTKFNLAYIVFVLMRNRGLCINYSCGCLLYSLGSCKVRKWFIQHKLGWQLCCLCLLPFRFPNLVSSVCILWQLSFLFVAVSIFKFLFCFYTDIITLDVVCNIVEIWTVFIILMFYGNYV